MKPKYLPICGDNWRRRCGGSTIQADTHGAAAGRGCSRSMISIDRMLSPFAHWDFESSFEGANTGALLRL